MSDTRRLYFTWSAIWPSLGSRVVLKRNHVYGKWHRRRTRSVGWYNGVWLRRLNRKRKRTYILNLFVGVSEYLFTRIEPWYLYVTKESFLPICLFSDPDTLLNRQTSLSRLLSFVYKRWFSSNKVFHSVLVFLLTKYNSYSEL